LILPDIIPVMMLHGIILDRGSRISLRRQLVGHLESRILGGQIGPGRRLPSVRRAEELLGLHRNTVSAAYRDLVQAGLARTRPGSGVYAQSPSQSREAGVALVTVHGSRDVGLYCEDGDLRAVLEAELRSRLAVRVHRSGPMGPQVRIQITPGVGFLRAIRILARPSLVCVCSGSDRLHRIASVATMIHGGEGLAYLPAIPGNRDSADRANRLAGLVAADYAALSWARNRLPVKVIPLPIISGYSFSELAPLLRPRGARSSHLPRTRGLTERSVQARVKEA
jgi:DNA-binding transcriptional regulator YhcF (GntR family)